MSMLLRRHGRVGAAVSLALIASGCAASVAPSSPARVEPAGDIRIGASFPLSSNAGGLASQELAGVEAAAEFVNADGGIDGRRVTLDVQDLDQGADAPAVMRTLKANGDVAVVGAYSSDLSIPASQAASDEGLVYWEAGAVADRLTGRGLPLVFRVGASGTNLGSNSATFAVSQIAPRLARTPAALRIAIVAADDDYAVSVADAAAATARTDGVPVVARLTYSLTVPDWPVVMGQLSAARPDVIILASHIPDGVAFRRAMIDAGLHVGALIGSTMAECDPDFAGDLGQAAVGVFASDRPTGGFEPTALDQPARALYDRFAAGWEALPGASTTPPGSTWPQVPSGEEQGPSLPEYTISGPVEAGSPAAGPSEEGLSGFAAGWALFHDVLPIAARAGVLDSEAIAVAARAVDLPMGALPNGAGLRFSSDPATLGQNERAAAVIWQWQAVRTYAFVWPPTYETGQISFVPLDR